MERLMLENEQKNRIIMSLKEKLFMLEGEQEGKRSLGLRSSLGN